MANLCKAETETETSNNNLVAENMRKKAVSIHVFVSSSEKFIKSCPAISYGILVTQ